METVYAMVIPARSCDCGCIIISGHLKKAASIYYVLEKVRFCLPKWKEVFGKYHGIVLETILEAGHHPK